MNLHVKTSLLAAAAIVVGSVSSARAGLIWDDETGSFQRVSHRDRAFSFASLNDSGFLTGDFAERALSRYVSFGSHHVHGSRSLLSAIQPADTAETSGGSTDTVYTPFDVNLFSVAGGSRLAGAALMPKTSGTTTSADSNGYEVYWTGNNGSLPNMSYYDNWSGNVRPDPYNGYSVIHFQGSNRTNPYNDFDSAVLNGAYVQFKAIYFDSGASSFTLNGESFKLYSADPNLAATIANNSSSGQTISVSSILTESDTYIAANAGNLTINSPIYADYNGGALYASAGSGKTLTFNGTLGQFNTTRSLNVAGPGTVVLNAANTYSGGTSVNSGTLLANAGTLGTSSATGTGAVGVTAGTLGGNGNISGPVTVASGANLSPGSSAATGTVGTLHTGALTLSTGSNYLVDLTGSGVDLTAVTGTVTLTGSNLTVATPVGFTPSSNYVIISNDGTDPVTGVFGSTLLPAGYTVDYFYNDTNNSLAGGNDVALVPITAIPEPSTWAAGLLAVTAVGFMQRRRVARLFHRAA